jgi:phospholipid/cholesterol/gamma-HCH transport system ATP-binding protein
MIAIAGLHKALGGRSVLRGVELYIPRGEVAALIGPSGTGKSVLLKHIVGLIQADAGDIAVGDVSVRRASRAQLYRLRRRMGFAFQDAALLDSLDVRDNLRLALPDDEVRDDAVAHARIDEALRLVNLDRDVLARKPAELSGGMRKRVGVARAVINRPHVILYDEPTTGLDPANASSMNALIRRIADTTGATCLVVTHEVHALHSFADRVITLEDGRVTADAHIDRGGTNGRQSE